jgi:hypothetical protein
MRQPHEEFENSRSKCEKAAPNPADYLGEIPLDYRARQQSCQSISKAMKMEPPFEKQIFQTANAQSTN